MHLKTAMGQFDGQEKKEDDGEEEEMEGKRMDEEDMHDGGWLNSQISHGSIATYAAPASRFSPARRS